MSWAGPGQTCLSGCGQSSILKMIFAMDDGLAAVRSGSRGEGAAQCRGELRVGAEKVVGMAL